MPPAGERHSLPARPGREKANPMGTKSPAGPNNWRNWLPLASSYLYVFAVAALALWFFHDREGRLPWWTDIPVAITSCFGRSVTGSPSRSTSRIHSPALSS